MGFVPTGKFGGINNPARTDATVPRSVTKWVLRDPGK
jgi:hypothetical protein